MFDRVDVHHARFCALAATDAFALVDGNVIETDFIEQAIDRAERAQDLTKAPSEEQTPHDDKDQYPEFYPEQSACGIPQ